MMQLIDLPSIEGLRDKRAIMPGGGMARRQRSPSKEVLPGKGASQEQHNQSAKRDKQAQRLL
jgi:hypothetical protein